MLGITAWHIVHGTLPHAITMGGVGFTALAANAASFWLLWQHRTGDANMHSAWICTRNDVLGNLAVLLAALGVFGTGTGWPDVIVAAIMAVLALQGSTIVIMQARAELRSSLAKLVPIERDRSGRLLPWSSRRLVQRDPPDGEPGSCRNSPAISSISQFGQQFRKQLHAGVPTLANAINCGGKTGCLSRACRMRDPGQA